jgi:hypothetical protein
MCTRDPSTPLVKTRGVRDDANEEEIQTEPIPEVGTNTNSVGIPDSRPLFEWS